MAFQMIPPRVSSSPPPLDSLPAIPCPGGEDDEDEFGDFANHNSSFDITGLSDKLPPTPDASPSKFPKSPLTVVAEGKNEDAFGQDLDIGSTISEAPPHLPTDSPRLNGGQSVPAGGGGRCDGSSEEFEDFKSSAVETKQDVSSFKEDEKASSHIGDCQSYAPNGTPPPLDYIATTTDLNNDFNAPPPLDHIATTTDLNNDFNAFYPVPDGIDDDFGDFNSVDLPAISKISDIKNGDNEIQEHDMEQQSGGWVDGGHVEINSANTDSVKKVTDGSEDGDSQTPEKWQSVHSGNCSTDSITIEQKIASDASAKETDPCVTIVSECDEGSTSEEQKHEDSRKDKPSDITSVNKTGAVELHSANNIESSASDIVLQSRIEGMQTEQVISEDLVNQDELKAPNKDSEVSDIENNFDDFVGTSCFQSAFNGDKTSDLDLRTDLTADKEAQSNNSSNQKAVEDNDSLSCSQGHTESVEQRADVLAVVDDDDFDFGDFHKPKASSDDDDLDFADIQARAESNMCEGEDLGSANDDGFGDFGHFASVTVAKQDDVDDFGDFGGAPTTDFGEFGTAQMDDDDDFGDFDTAQTLDGDDDFADFYAMGDKEKSPKEMGWDSEFGDFSGSALEDVGAGEEKAEPNFGDFSGWRGSEPSEGDRPVLRKLESLVLKWIPAHHTTSSENGTVPSLEQVVENDAFVWHPLENLEASTALKLSWPSTHAHNLFLASVNVDARNILFGQKWSSSVPLFAQTLTFSPLTPAKSSEGGPGVGSLESIIQQPVSAAPPPATDRPSDVTREETAGGKPGTPEEQIPPAKFDWTSSGLTNPLEGPGLEREFLSEGAEKTSGGRAKSAPTPSPLVQQILGGGMAKTPTTTTPLGSLQPDVRTLVEQLPDLGFMRSTVLMFPIRGEQ